MILIIQDVYVDVPAKMVTSVCYAEDDDRHIIGMKAVQQDTGYCCHVIECADAVSQFLYPSV